MRLGLEVNFLFLDRRGLGHSTFYWARETGRLARERGAEVVFLTGPLPPSSPPWGAETLEEWGPVKRVEEPSDLRKLDLDLLHLQDLISPYRLPESAASRLVVTVHDLIPLLFPQQTPAEMRRRWEKMLSLLPRADAVVSISRATARDLLAALERRGERLKKLVVISPGVDHGRFHPHHPERDIALFRTRHRLPHPCILYVSGGDFRKNHPLLIEAFIRFLRLCSASTGWHLVLAGPDTGVYRILVSGTPWEERVKFLDFFPEEEMPFLYAAASLFAFPSLYEGFGLPLLEALASGVPAVASRAGALPEVAGDAALLLPPRDPQAWAEAFCLLSQSEEKRLLWREKGLRRAALFTWQKTAENHFWLYRRLARPEAGKGKQG